MDINYFQKLIELSEKCKIIHGKNAGEFSVSYNPHLSCYETPSEHLSSIMSLEECSDLVMRGIALKCDEEDRLVTINFYSASPVGHFFVFGTNLEDTAKKVIACVERESGCRNNEV